MCVLKYRGTTLWTAIITLDLLKKGNLRKFSDNKTRNCLQKFYFCSICTEINIIWMNYLFSCSQPLYRNLMNCNYTRTDTWVHSRGRCISMHNCFQSTQLHMLHIKMCLKSSLNQILNKDFNIDIILIYYLHNIHLLCENVYSTSFHLWNDITVNIIF